MANIWRKDDNFVDQPKRNIFDLSFQNNGTYQFGKLYPVFCKEVIPGDSFRIKPTFALKFQPMVFPIQTRIKAYLHFFKVRNRNLWKDFPDFISKNKENLVPPYLDTNYTKPTTKGLLDYLGVPTTITGTFGNYDELTVENLLDNTISYYSLSSGEAIKDYVPVVSDNINTSNVTSSTFKVVRLNEIPDNVTHVDVYFTYSNNTNNLPIDSFMNMVVFSPTATDSASSQELPMASGYKPFNSVLSSLFKICVTSVNEPETFNILSVNDGHYLGNGIIRFQIPSDYNTSRQLFICIPNKANLKYNNADDYAANPDLQLREVVRLNQWYFEPTQAIYLSNNGEDGVRDIDDSNSPYWRSGATTDFRSRIKLSALPCRAYESIYNSFYRNAENNPYMLNGVAEYNKWLPTQEGGVDSNVYDLHYRNWEDDFLTTALQQPQAGVAPLVGLTGTAGTAIVTMEGDDGVTTASAQYDEDGNITSMSADGALSEALMDTVTYGISINDLRNVNAFQRWLERKARGGYKYRDQIKAQFGVTVRYDELDMPEFLGGTILDIIVNQISQTTPTESSPLGDYAGQASGVGSGKTINEYIDEHGYIIGILSVVPVPNYSQLLPKHFLKRDAFDFFFPEFGHIGMQPINYDEVTPIQSYAESTEHHNALDDVFGYQRAWYEYLASTDEVHGEFRTSLRNFVMNRVFDVRPDLSESFLLVDPKHLNDVFAIQDESFDKILGQIYFDVKAKRPIPMYGIPKLE